ncbi:SDR family NAD(P)-dependent oxidoreductase [Rudaeicoccus suwonensis]|uniref:NAD(P)-dependent dehydrogenase (Short-subunit alcohol dehydrogenase family) n=1 Tax=Rudaeicoccus suwonensis TaxID=657409 RepID=A0A561EBR8_9MICO|nr:SDR family NAD(P)-dependent oxidoreductase [Rudaeicoccus suwonensis]TWE13054.1 NAD(P)-dependent dehydrogenase (short-subunit alcohol dehydrogenase family) [Rudaeicoccus suwonensis]
MTTAARVFVTGSTDGLGHLAARALMNGGHEVVVHARNADRLKTVRDLIDQGAAAVVGDLSDQQQTREVAKQVNQLGRMDAVIHNAGIMSGPNVMSVNVVAPYLLTALIDRPERLVYLSSSLHQSGRADLTAIDPNNQEGNVSYSDSKLLVTTLAAAVARRWPGTLTNAVDPGWVPTKMGGASATDDIDLGYRTQVWLATSNAPEALTSGGYWYHQHRTDPARATNDESFQDQLLEELAHLTDERLADSDPPRPAPADPADTSQTRRSAR